MQTVKTFVFSKTVVLQKPGTTSIYLFTRYLLISVYFESPSYSTLSADYLRLWTERFFWAINVLKCCFCVQFIGY